MLIYSILNSKANINISNFIFKRKLDNYTKNNNTVLSNNNKTDDYNNNEASNMNMTENKTNNNVTKKKDDKTSIEEEPGTYLIGFFVLFAFMGIYMICKMKDYKETENRTDDVWKFLFFANNGALLGSIIDIFFSNNIIVEVAPLALSGIIFGIGSIYYLIHYIKNCNHEYASQYFSCEKVGEWFDLPCFIISLIGLTDPCCRSETYTVTEYEDGHKESTYCCNCCWNSIIWIIKRIVLFMTILSYYIFVIFLLIFWFLALIIYIATANKKQNNDKSSNSNTQTGENNDTQTNSTKSDGANSTTIKNQLKNNEQINVINQINLNNGDDKNIIQNANYPNSNEIGGNPLYNDIQQFKSEVSIKNFKEYFNEPKENKNDKFGKKSINSIHKNINGNFAQKENNPEINSIPKSIVEFY